jgi:Uma2 family endonuclease
LQTYPDASVFCDRIQFAPEDPANTTALNPTVLFEVLSRSTEGYDRGFKADNYRRIESLNCYVLVSQENAHVEVYERQAEGAWLLREAKGLSTQVTIPSIEVTLPLADVYDRVEFQGRVSPLENEPEN